MNMVIGGLLIVYGVYGMVISGSNIVHGIKWMIEDKKTRKKIEQRRNKA